MTYRLGSGGGLILLAVASFVLSPGVPLVTKALTLNNIGPAALGAAMAGISALIFFVVGESMASFSGERDNVYRRFLTMPDFYWLTLLKAAGFFFYFNALTYLPATILIGVIVLRPSVIYNLRRLYRPKEMRSNITVLMITGIVSLYVATFGFSLPAWGQNVDVWYGLGYALLTLLVTSLYAIEKESAVKKTESWSSSLRFGALHRTLIFLCFAPFLSMEALMLPVTNFMGTGGGLVALGVVASAGWFVGLHTTRLLGAYYASYKQFIKTGMVAVGEALLLGIVLSLPQYIGVVGLLAIFVLICYDVNQQQ